MLRGEDGRGRGAMLSSRFPKSWTRWKASQLSAPPPSPCSVCCRRRPPGVSFCRRPLATSRASRPLAVVLCRLPLAPSNAVVFCRWPFAHSRAARSSSPWSPAAAYRERRTDATRCGVGRQRWPSVRCGVTAGRSWSSAGWRRRALGRRRYTRRTLALGSRAGAGCGDSARGFLVVFVYLLFI